MNLILFSVTTFAVLDYFYRFMRFVSTDLAKIAKFLCFYSKSGFRGLSFDAQTAHVAIVFTRYTMLSLENRFNLDVRSIGVNVKL